jgi:hypothetical protein
VIGWVRSWLDDRCAEKLTMAADRPGKGAYMNDLAVDMSYLSDCVCSGRPDDDPRPFNMRDRSKASSRKPHGGPDSSSEARSSGRSMGTASIHVSRGLY